MNNKIEVLISEEKIQNRINKIAQIINHDYANKKLHIICILKGSIFYACDLAKLITVPVTIDFMKVSSYGGEMVSSGKINILQDLSDSIENRDVLIVEDIIDTGITLSTLVPILEKRNPSSIKITTLLDKPSRRKVNINVDYIGFEIDDYFVVGYGLDHDQKYRNLPYIGVIK